MNPDGTLCLESPINLLGKLSAKPDLLQFAESCLIPYLYCVSHKLKNGGKFLFGELAHGPKGILDDYKQLWGLQSPEQVWMVLNAMKSHKREANKMLCPCGCGKRLGVCSYNRYLARLRKIAPRNYYKKQLDQVTPYFPQSTLKKLKKYSKRVQVIE
ncbi:hypothetical protein [Saccharibacillus qingshengii]|uniref:hypothetical protein n=1 Tax=Saccharibacillus qingshengii TaxID=1763540 RepID=UPI00155760F0|nr:hypothetical protein [Saccharibacillus qingshengii]